MKSFIYVCILIVLSGLAIVCCFGENVRYCEYITINVLAHFCLHYNFLIILNPTVYQSIDRENKIMCKLNFI